MTKQIFNRIILEIALANGLVFLLLFLTYLLIGRDQGTISGSLGVAIWIFWRHSTYSRWKKVAISAVFLVGAVAAMSWLTAGEFLVSRSAFFWLGLASLALAGLVWRFLPLSPAFPKK